MIKTLTTLCHPVLIPLFVWLLYAFTCACAAESSEKVVLQLAWTHQFQFAGYYAALNNGYYQEQGLDVEIIEGGEGRFAREALLNGRAQYGVAGAELVLHRMDGDPFVVLAPIFQHSPAILLGIRDSGISNLQDLIGKRVMLLPGKKDADILAAFLREGISLDSIQRLDLSYDIGDLVNGRTDVLSAYLTNEPWQLIQAGFTPVVLSPQTYGVDFYSDCLFTTEEEIENRPKRVRAFMDASLRGWKYAMSRPEEIIDLLLNDYGVQKNREHLRYEAGAIRKIMLPDLVQIGHMNPGRWQHIAGTYARLGMISSDFDLNGFLYDPDTAPSYTGLKWGVAISISVLMLISAGTVILLVFNRKLAREIKERKEAEEAVTSFFDQSLVMLYMADMVTGRLIRVNQEVERITGRSEEDLLSTPFIEFIHPDDRESTLKAMARLNQGKPLAGYQNRHVTVDGEVRIFEWNAVPDTEHRLVYAMARDITKQNQMEKALHLTLNKFEKAFKAAPVWVVLSTVEDGRYIEVNDSFLSTMGFKREEVIGQTSLQLNSWVDPDERKRIMKKVRETGGVRNEEVKRRVRSGVVIDTLFSAEAFRLEGLLVMICVTQNITDQKKAEADREKLQAQLLQAQKLESIGRLAGGVAHDFNNMLSIIIGNTEMIIEDMDPSSPMVANMREVHKAAERSTNFTRQLLAFARKQTISPKVLDLNDIIEGMFKMLRRLIGEDIDLVWLPKIELWPVKVDPSQVDQILANLCVNARDSIKNVGKVTIETGNMSFDETYCREHEDFKPGDYVMIAVSDNGSGMDRDLLENIFEPFFTTKDVGEGTGLGLATVYGIVKQNNGFLNVYSEPGQGTTFKIYLPRHAEEPASKDEMASTEILQTGNETILLVEDEESILRITRKMLERMGYHVLGAQTPGEAIQLAQAKNFSEIHLLITDVVMPEMNGRDLSRKLIQLYPNLKCLFMSGYSANVIAHHGVLEPGVQFINKPFSKPYLAAKVRQVLDE